MWTDKRTGITELIIAFRNSAKAPKNDSSHYHIIYFHGWKLYFRDACLSLKVSVLVTQRHWAIRLRRFKTALWSQIQGPKCHIQEELIPNPHFCEKLKKLQVLNRALIELIKKVKPEIPLFFHRKLTAHPLQRTARYHIQINNRCLYWDS
jgi:hypothetical protein